MRHSHTEDRSGLGTLKVKTPADCTTRLKTRVDVVDLNDVAESGGSYDRGRVFPIATVAQAHRARKRVDSVKAPASSNLSTIKHRYPEDHRIHIDLYTVKKAGRKRLSV